MTQLHSATRDLRIDFVRGLALMMIFINHIPGNVAAQYTTRNFGFSDAAELFVLLAGFAAASAYWRPFEAGETLATALRVWRRAGLLYSAHILTTVLAIALFAGTGAYAVRPDLAASFNIAPLLADPAGGILGLAALTHFLSYFNILPLYIVLLAMLPPAMLLYRFDPRLLFAASLALYLAAGFWRLHLPSYPGPDAWYFNPLSWQFLFVAGFLWGDLWRQGRALARNRILFWAAVAYLVLALVWVRVDFAPWFPAYAGLGELWGFSKTYLAPFRLLHVLALAYVVAMSPLGGWLARIAPASPLTLMGRHALPVFCLGSLLSLVFYLQREMWGGSVPLDLAAVALGLTLQVALARFLDWQAVLSGRHKAAAGPVAVAVPAFTVADAALPPVAAGR